MTTHETDAEISMILDTYMYTDYAYAEDGQTLSEIVSEMPEHIDVEDTYRNEYEILKEAVTDPKVGDLVIMDQSRDMGYNEGTNACTFMNEDRSKVFVVFRGTADGEWLDNGKGLTQSSTTQQREALRYFDEVMEKEGIMPWQQVIPTGHSKGANKVQYITMESAYAYLIDQCYAVDGQGFSHEAIRGWKERYSREEYGKRTGKIFAINGENDFVSVLGTSIILPSHRIFIQTPAEKKDFAAYHDITRMFAHFETDEKGTRSLVFTGNRNPCAAGRGSVSLAALSVSEEVMKLPEELRDGCAASLMQLVESLNGGKQLGVNGERMTPADGEDFLKAGVSSILYSIFCKEDGRTFFRDLLLSEDFSRRFRKGDDLKVNYSALVTAGEMLRNLAFHLQNNTARIETDGFLLPFYMNGVMVKKAQIEEEVWKLYLIQKKLLALSELLVQIGKMYRVYDESTQCC